MDACCAVFVARRGGARECWLAALLETINYLAVPSSDKATASIHRYSIKAEHAPAYRYTEHNNVVQTCESDDRNGTRGSKEQGSKQQQRKATAVAEQYVKQVTMAAYRTRNGSNPAITAVFFDLDNTLIETRKGDSLACRKLTEELTQKYGVPQETSNKITAAYLKQFRKCPDNPAYSLDTWRTNLWSKALGAKYSCLCDEIYSRWLYLRYRYLALEPETSSMLRQMRKKYLLGLITNGPSNAQWEKVHKLELEQYFHVVLVSGDLPWEKPQARIFEEACRCLNVTPNHCLMVGDKLETDILGGIEANLAGTVWIPITDKTRLSSEDPKPDFTIKRITDLLVILKRGPGASELEDSSSNASDGS